MTTVKGQHRQSNTEDYERKFSAAHEVMRLGQTFTRLMFTAGN